MFLEDCDNFKDYFQTIFEMYIKESLTKEEAIERLKIEYAFEQGKVKENYQKMYPDKQHLDYKFDEFVDFLKKGFLGETTENIILYSWEQWRDDFLHHSLKNQETNTNIEKILHKEISEEMLAILRLLYLDSDRNQTISDVFRAFSNTSSSKNKQQHTDETVLTSEQAQQEKDKIYGLLIKKSLIEKITIKDKPKYRLTEAASIPAIYKTIKEKAEAGSIKIDDEDIYNFLKTLKDKNGGPTKDAVNSLKSKNEKNR
jgi:hypothetical protein